MEEQRPDIIERGLGVESFDRIHGGLAHAQSLKKTRPSTVVETMPIIGTRVTYIVQSFKTDHHGFVLSIEVLDGQGPVRLILPDKVVKALYRQRESLADRSTPESRARKARKAERAKKAKAKAERKAKWAAQLVAT